MKNVDEPQGSIDSIQGPNSFELAAKLDKQANVDEVMSTIPHSSTSNGRSDPHSFGKAASLPLSGGPSRVPRTVDQGVDCGVSKFDTSAVIRGVRREAAIMLADSIFSLLDRAPLEKLPSLQVKFEEIYQEFALLGVDYSPLRKRLESYVGNAAKYVSIQTKCSDAMTSASQSNQLASISQRISQESGFKAKDVENVHVMRREQYDLDAKRAQLREELGKLDARSVQLGTSIEEIETQTLQRQATIDRLVKERVAIEQAELVTEGDLQVVNTLRNMLDKEREEIKQTPWI